MSDVLVAYFSASGVTEGVGFASGESAENLGKWANELIRN